MNNVALEDSLKYIKSWLQFRYSREEIPGFVVAIAHKGNILLNEAYGYSNLEKKIKLTPNHMFRIASQSKTFTATALMQLQEQGKLNIDDNVIGYLPWLKDHKDKRWQKITIRQLMSHGAGIIRDGLDADYWSLERPFPSKEQLKKEILETDLVIDNNIKLKYSNFGYSLLGMVIESISGKTYNEYVSENIVNRLGLKNTGPEYKSDIEGKLVTGYTRLENNRKRLPIGNISTNSMSAATGFYSTSEDLCRYFSAQLIGSNKLLNDESKKEMQRIQFNTVSSKKDNNNGYGLGLELEYINDKKTIGHGGGFPGYITRSIIDINDELVITVLTNCLGGSAGEIARGIHGIINYFQNNFIAKKSKHNLTKFEGHYMALTSNVDIVVIGENIVSVHRDTWRPFDSSNDIEELEYVDNKTLKITRANSFSSEGELVHFNTKKGEKDFIIYAGKTMWPAEYWFKKQNGRQKVELRNSK